MEYTKGEWFYHNGNIENGDHVTCTMNRIGDKVSSDALLISQAPKLYESLKYIIRELDKANIIRADSIFMEMPNKVISRVEGGKVDEYY